MKSFLGIHFSKQKESDEQYIEQIRKRVRKNKKLAFVWPIIALLNLVVFIGVMIIFQMMLEPFAQGKDVAHNSETHFLWTGFLVGSLLGAWAGLVLFKTGVYVKHWLDARKGLRTERLLLEYYDKAKGK